MMRTTLDLDRDVLDAARVIARLESVSLGTAISGLARRGLSPPVRVGRRNGLPVIQVPKGGPRITDEMVAAALEEW